MARLSFGITMNFWLPAEHLAPVGIEFYSWISSWKAGWVFLLISFFFFFFKCSNLSHTQTVFCTKFSIAIT